MLIAEFGFFLLFVTIPAVLLWYSYNRGDLFTEEKSIKLTGRIKIS